MFSIVLLLLAAGFVQAQARDPRALPLVGTASVRGQVIDRPTGAPVPGARVFLGPRPTRNTPPNSDMFSAESTTAHDGRFEFTGIPAGQYFLSAGSGELRAGHLLKVFGSNEAVPYIGPPSLELAAGEERSDITIALERALAIEGRVVNEYGEPMAHQNVTATGIDAFGGSLTPTTDDRGWFRVYGLHPGTYRVCAEPGSDRWMSGVLGDGLDTRYDRSCAPDLVALKPGDVPFVTIHAQRSGAFSIRGTVVSSTGADISRASIHVVRLRPDGSESVRSELHEGRFSANGLLPGEYVVHALLRDDQATFRRQFQESTMTAVRISDSDVTDLSLVMVPAATVAGRIERDPRSIEPLPTGLTVRMMPPLDRIRYTQQQPPEAAVGRDGTFELRGVFGAQVIGVSNLTRGWFVASVRHGRDEITNEPREFRQADDLPVVIVLSDRSATLLARPTGADGKPRADAVVLAVPVDPKGWNAVPTYQLFGRDPAEFVELSGLKPGDYFVAAVSMQDMMRVLREPPSVEPLARAGRRLTLVAGETLRADVPVVSLEAAR